MTRTDGYLNPVSSSPFVSYAQNGEDVVLFRALGGVDEGRYIDVGANDPFLHSITYAFYQRRWSGITIDPVHAYAVRHRAERPRDVMVEAAITDDPSGTVTLHQIDDTGLSTLIDHVSADHREAGWNVQDVTVPALRLDKVLTDAGWEGLDIHFMVVDTEGAEATVLGTLNFRQWRPWVLVIEATKPLTTEPTYESWEPMVVESGYRFCFFDGLSRFYVVVERWDQLHSSLSIPAGVLDDYISHHDLEREQEVNRLLKAATDLTADRDRLAAELDQLRHEMLEHDAKNAAAILDWRRSAIKAWAVAVRTDRVRQIESLNRQIESHLNHIVHVDDELGRAKDEVEAMKHTVSWRLTKPLRRIRRVSARSKP